MTAWQPAIVLFWDESRLGHLILTGKIKAAREAAVGMRIYVRDSLSDICPCGAKRLEVKKEDAVRICDRLGLPLVERDTYWLCSSEVSTD